MLYGRQWYEVAEEEEKEDLDTTGPAVAVGLQTDLGAIGPAVDERSSLDGRCGTLDRTMGGTSLASGVPPTAASGSRRGCVTNPKAPGHAVAEGLQADFDATGPAVAHASPRLAHAPILSVPCDSPSRRLWEATPLVLRVL